MCIVLQGVSDPIAVFAEVTFYEKCAFPLTTMYMDVGLTKNWTLSNSRGMACDAGCVEKSVRVDSTKVKFGSSCYPTKAEAIAAFERSRRRKGIAPPLRYPPSASGDSITTNELAYPRRTCAAGMREGHGWVYLTPRTMMRRLGDEAGGGGKADATSGAALREVGGAPVAGGEADEGKSDGGCCWNICCRRRVSVG